MRVAVLGRTKILYDTIDKVKDAGHEIVLIGTCKAAIESEIREADFEKKAKEMGIPFFYDSKINADPVLSMLREAEADIAISINWVTVIEDEAIESFKYGILNAHCGDLPRYRGNACPNWAILNGEKEYGLSIHFMVPGELDSGNIVIKKKYEINKGTTITDVYNNLENEIPELFCEALDAVLVNGKYEIQSTNPKDALRCYPRIPYDSIIDWNQPCDNIIRLVNASTLPFEGAYTFYDNRKLYIHEAVSSSYEYPCCVVPGQVIFVDKINGEVRIAALDGFIKIEHFHVGGGKNTCIQYSQKYTNPVGLQNAGRTVEPK